MIFELPPPAIIHPEPSELRADAQMQRLGLPRHVRRAILAEVKRLVGKPASVIRPTLDDLARYGGADAAKLGFIFAPGLRHRKAAVNIAYVASSAQTNDNNTNTYTFTNVPIGSGQFVIVTAAATGANNQGSLSSGTVAGNAATVIGSRATTSADSPVAGIMVIAHPGGSTATITITWSTSKGRAGIAVFSMNGASGVAAFDSAGASNADPVSTTAVDIPANGGAVAVACANPNTSYSWTGLTEAHDTVMEATSTFSSASGNFASAQTGPTIQADNAINNTTQVLFAASWGP